MDFSSTIIGWYKDNHRPLPWRETDDPYRIWVSEVIMQQTRVDQGLSYYHNFLEKFPDIHALANAREQDVLKAWQGLGYYSRARNMHHTAQKVVEWYGGGFPPSYAELLSLKGIGDYTASAIASIAFRLPHPVVDGNVLRFISRLKGVSEPVTSGRGVKIIRSFLEKEIDTRDPGTFNQAIMEFGALVCTPRNPTCEACPFQLACVAYTTGSVDKFPIKEKKAPQKARYFHYLVHILIEDNQVFTFFNKRKGNDIWKNMFEFPMVETDRMLEWEELKTNEGFRKLWKDEPPQLIRESGIFRHVLSHRILMARYFVLACTSAPEGFYKLKLNEMEKFPLPRLMEKIVEDIDITFQSKSD